MINPLSLFPAPQQPKSLDETHTQYQVAEDPLATMPG
jgi:hypothetical protein